MDKKEELQKWLNDDKYLERKQVGSLYDVSHATAVTFLRQKNIEPIKSFIVDDEVYFFYETIPRSIKACSRNRCSKI